MTLADKIVVLQNGIIEQCGSPLELYHHPKNRFVAGFLGSPRMNFMDVTLGTVAPKTLTVHLPEQKKFAVEMEVPADMAHLREGSTLTLGIRPEHCVECAPEDSLIAGSVRVVEHLGSEIYAYLKLENDTSLMVRTRGDHPVKIGDNMHFTFDAKSCHLFDQESERSLADKSYAFETAAIDPMRF